MPTGTSVTYISGTGPVGRLPTADSIRPTHQEREPKPKGIDFDALTPTCKECGEKSRQLDGTSRCPPCRGEQPTRGRHKKARHGYDQLQLPQQELDARFRGPDDTRLGRALGELEAENPAVAASSKALDETIDQIIHPDDHVIPDHLQIVDDEPAPATVTELPGRPTALQNLDAQVDHAARVLRRSAGVDDPIVNLLRLNVLSSLESLHLFLELHHRAPVASSSTPDAAGPRQAAAAVGEAARQPATKFETFQRPRRVMNTDEARRQRRRTTGTRASRNPVNELAIIEEYKAGASAPEIAQRHGCGPARVRGILDAASVPRRDDRTTRSGGRNKITHDDPELVEKVRRLYVDEQLSTADVADQIGLGRKKVVGILSRAGVALRPAGKASGRGDLDQEATERLVARYVAGEGLHDLAREHHVRVDLVRQMVRAAGHQIRPKGASGLHRQRLDALGVTAHDLKAWALGAGLIERIPTGLPAGRLIDAYAAAHNTTGDG